MMTSASAFIAPFTANPTAVVTRLDRVIQPARAILEPRLAPPVRPEDGQGTKGV
jgi:hypothetical protein